MGKPLSGSAGHGRGVIQDEVAKDESRHTRSAVSLAVLQSPLVTNTPPLIGFSCPDVCSHFARGRERVAERLCDRVELVAFVGVALTMAVLRKRVVHAHRAVCSGETVARTRTASATRSERATLGAAATNRNSNWVPVA